MPEPTTVVISSIVALAQLAQKGIRSFLASEAASSAVAAPITGTIEDISSDLARQGFNRIVANLPAILRTPENHDLLRAVRRSYLNATLVMCFARLQLLNPSKLDVRNFLLQFLQPGGTPSRVVEVMRNSLKPHDEEMGREIDWLLRAISELNQSVAGIEQWQPSGVIEQVTNTSELLLQPEKATSHINEVQATLKEELIAELAEIAYFQVYATDEVAGEDRYRECLPPELLKMIEEGWSQPADDGSILKQAAEDIEFEWFDVLSVFFAEELKSPDSRAGKIFYARLLADLKYRNGQPCNLSVEEFSAQLAKANEPLTKSLANIEKELSGFKGEIRQLLPLVVTVNDSAEIIKTLPALLRQIQEAISAGFSGFERPVRPKFSSRSNIPAPVKGFIGREAELDKLREAKAAGKTSFVLYGPGGAGKTELALRFIEEISHEFQAHVRVDMEGLSEHALSPTDAMLEVIRRLDPNAPAKLGKGEIRARFNSCLRQPDVRSILFLDNVKDGEQVEPLNQRPAFVIATSRTVFHLGEGVSLAVGQMSQDDARNLLFSIAGEERFEGQADNLAELAGFLPMSLKPLGAFLAEYKFEKATDVINRYRDKKALLQERVPGYRNSADPDAKSLTVGASFELSYEALSEELKEPWKWLSVFQSDFDEERVKDFLGISIEEAAETLRQLYRLSLLESNPETRRFRLHDLAREFADSKFDDLSGASFLKRLRFSILPRWVPGWVPVLFPTERFLAQIMYADYFAFILGRASNLKESGGESGYTDALKLIDKEWGNIKAAQKWVAGVAEISPDLAKTCCKYASTDSELLNLRLTPKETVNWQKAALRAARKLGDKKRESIHLNNIGVAYRELGEYDEAIKHHTESLQIAERIEEKSWLFDCLGNLGSAYGSRGDYKKALEYAERALDIARQTKRRSMEGSALTKLGSLYSGMGEYRKAVEFHTKGLEIARESGNLYWQSLTLYNLATDYYHLGDEQKAHECSALSFQISQQIGDRHGLSAGLSEQGNSYSSVGEYESAVESYEKSLEIARESGDLPGEATILHNLAVHHLRYDEYEKAAKHLERALQISQQIGSKVGELNCLGGLSTIFGTVGEYEIAIEFIEQALRIAREIGERSEEGMNLYRLGLAFASLGDAEKACVFLNEALVIMEEIESPRAELVRRMIRENC